MAGNLVQAGRAKPDPAPRGTWMLWPAMVAASVVAVVLGYLAGGAAFTSEPPPPSPQPVVARVEHEPMLQEAFAPLPGAEETLVLLAFNGETEGGRNEPSDVLAVTGGAWADAPRRASAEDQTQPVLKSIPGRNVLAGANSIGGFVMKKVAFIFTLILAVAIRTGSVVAMDLARVD